LVGLGVEEALGGAGVADDALVGVDGRVGLEKVVCPLGSMVVSLALQATMSSATGSTPSRFM